MQIHQMVKEAINAHKEKIELTQWAIISAVSSLVYSEYLIRMKQKQYPRRMIMIAPIRAVQELFLPDGPMFTTLSDKLIDGMAANELFQKFADAPELEMFKPDNIEIMKTIFDLYILPNISKRVPETIARKFDLFNEQNQTFRQDNSIDLFNRQPFNEEQLNYVIEEAVLQLLMLIPTMKKEIEYPEGNTSIYMTDDEVLTISNENALSSIHFNPRIFGMGVTMNVLRFVTNTTIKENDWGANPICKGDHHYPITYIIDTGLFNGISLTRLIGIECEPQTEEKGEGA